MVLWVKVSLHEHELGVTWLERGGAFRTGNALVADERVWLIDPFDHPESIAAATGRGTPAGVVQLLDRHSRDCAAIASRLGVPHLRLPANSAGTPFTPVRVVWKPRWREVALWWHDERALVVPEAIGTLPVFALGRRAGVHPVLRLLPPRGPLAPFSPERLFVGHGDAITSDADAALREALAHSRRDLPKLVAQAPKLLRR